MSNEGKFEIPLGVDLVISKENYDKWMDALVERIVEKMTPVEVSALGGVKIYAQPFVPNDVIMMVGPDPEFPGRTKVLKVIKFTS